MPYAKRTIDQVQKWEEVNKRAESLIARARGLKAQSLRLFQKARELKRAHKDQEIAWRRKNNLDRDYVFECKYAEVFRLRAQGMKYARIGEVVGVSTERARCIVMKQCGRLYARFRVPGLRDALSLYRAPKDEEWEDWFKASMKEIRELYVKVTGGDPTDEDHDYYCHKNNRDEKS